MKMFHYLLFPLTFLGTWHSNVSSQNFQGGQKATEALFASGAQKIANITGANNTGAPSDYRLAGYKQTMENMHRKNDSTKLIMEPLQHKKI